MYPDHMNSVGYGCGFMGGIPMFIGLVAIFAIIYLIVKNTKRSDVGKNESPMDILKKRYANGEISQEEFEKIKKDILQIAEPISTESRKI